MMQYDPNSCQEFNRLNRRQFIGTSAGAIAAATAAGTLPSWFPHVVLGGEPGAGPCGAKVFIEIFMRGGADGAAMIIPHGDDKYYADDINPANGLPIYRPAISPLYVPPPTVGDPMSAIDLDGFFGLAPALQLLKPVYDEGGLCLATGVAMENQSYSHFTAQNWTETGVSNPQATYVNGYMARHINSIAAPPCNPVLRGIGVRSTLQRGLFGGDRTLAVPDPADFELEGPAGTAASRLISLDTMYSQSAFPDFPEVSAVSRGAIETLRNLDIGNYVPSGGANYGTHTLGKSLKALAAIIKGDIGLQVAEIDTPSWDFHSNQKNNVVGGGMWNRMWQLAEAMSAFWLDLKSDTPSFLDCVVLCVRTEFGRTIGCNGLAPENGTDHGYGTVMFLMGGKVNGGQVINAGLWPGLSHLHNTNRICDENQVRDMCAITDPRELLVEVFDRFMGNYAGLPIIFPEFSITPPNYLGCIRD
ncbi:MAG: DUF1501 domain-containing protein [Phycisphaerales bacterium]|nr:DUF1501 domain-containing protein [Phycisphaerales bacterium]MCB9862337.1 DUF1501 domain-containing protein [Phycisphaerales bacterium]